MFRHTEAQTLHAVQRARRVHVDFVGIYPFSEDKRRLTRLRETIFSKNLNIWHEKYKDFLAEKTLNELTGKSFIHAKLMSVY